jgi:hypothetical protein
MPNNTNKINITTWNNYNARKHKQKIYHNFDYFLKKHEQEEQEHHWLGARGTSSQSLKDEGLIV